MTQLQPEASAKPGAGCVGRQGRLLRLPVRAALVAAVCAGLGWVGAGVSGADPASFDTERAVVERLHGALLAAMRSAADQPFDTRREGLRGVILETFDFAFMAEKSAGRHWRALDDTQRQALTAAIADLAVSNYAARFDDYDGERFETTATEAANYDTVLVRTEIVQRGGTATRLDYRLRGTAEGPRVIDIFLNGTVSELAMRRAEYSSVIQREGFDSLLTALHQRVAALPVSAR